MLAKKYNSTIVSIIKHFNGIYTIEFESSKEFKYLPGQFLHLATDDDYDGIGQWPESRCFSMQSNPNESLIKITYSTQGSFTKSMELNLKVGKTVWLKLPYGDLFSQEHNKSNTIFIAGGTGVTPYLSLFTHESFKEYSNPIIYLGFKSKEYNIYTSEIELAKKINPTVIFNINYENINGRLDINKIYDNSNKNSSFYISGPPLMIKNFKEILISKGLSSNQIKTDDWE